LCCEAWQAFVSTMQLIGWQHGGAQAMTRRLSFVVSEQLLAMGDYHSP